MIEYFQKINYFLSENIHKKSRQTAGHFLSVNDILLIVLFVQTVQ